ncbi:MAG TPA: nitrilase-related carbon-nitrogen hydrolase [bacterium]|nr:nitrilase-related carbon-nitrogen hydrolase [bacterium]
MRIALIQNHPLFGEVENNINRLLTLIESVDADLYILPELCFTGYQFVSREEVARLAVPPDGAVIGWFRQIAKERNVSIAFGYPELSPEGSYNAAMVVTPDGRDLRYRKTHLFYREKEFFLPGDSGFGVIEWNGLRIGLAVCFDWYFPESFRTLALKGADIIAHCSNLVMPYCQQADLTRALENRVYIATANRVGTEDRGGEALTFTGGSVLVSPRGEYLLTLPKEEEVVMVAEIDIALAREKKINRYNDIIADRRPEFYNG